MIAHASELEQANTATSVDHLWGLDQAGLHDRLWASRGIQVVRRGRPEALDASGPTLYLLLDAEDCVLFHIGPLMKRLSWIRPRAVRLRIVDRDRTAFLE
ncbi:MAG: hypothetical protein KDA28_07755, partial [Phycisphaerales bacterium]|nr:hypothetical protein [Phycisphaerales bacterium]